MCRVSLRGSCSRCSAPCWQCLQATVSLKCIWQTPWRLCGQCSLAYCGASAALRSAFLCAISEWLSDRASLSAHAPDSEPYSPPIFTGNTQDLTMPVIVGVVVTLIGIGVIGVAGNMKSQSLSDEEKKKAVKDFNFTKGIIVALLAGFMSACFSIGLGFGEHLNFGDATDPMFRTLPATFLVTLGGFVTNAVYCFYQNGKNRTWGDYSQTSLYLNNIVFCALAGLLWYSQFFGLSLGKGFLTDSPVLLTFSWCILMALNVTFSNVWGIILKEWKGCSQKTIAVLVAGIIILVVSSFLPQLLK